jgi:hypothetical protein
MSEEIKLVPTISFGNKKIGDIWSFSLPSFVTCPGASTWCREKCYSRRYEQYRPSCRYSYNKNLATSLMPHFIPKILEKLPETTNCLRIHVSGDFYSPEYINSWYEICKQRPNTIFWGFTRSWSVERLLPEINKLRELPNVVLIGSTDPSMELPPDDWRVAYIETDERANGLKCPQQRKKVDSCKQCKYCYSSKNKGSVIFKIH